MEQRNEFIKWTLDFIINKQKTKIIIKYKKFKIRDVYKLVQNEMFVAFIEMKDNL